MNVAATWAPEENRARIVGQAETLKGCQMPGIGKARPRVNCPCVDNAPMRLAERQTVKRPYQENPECLSRSSYCKFLQRRGYVSFELTALSVCDR